MRSEAVFHNCNVCGRDLIREDELAVGMCAICANEEIDDDPNSKSERLIKTIAEQDALIPRCKRACSTCFGFSGRLLNHHWMLDFPEPEDGKDCEIHLKCRHCEAKITEFDTDDENCPEI